jgi:hypothetical protein
MYQQTSLALVRLNSFSAWVGWSCAFGISIVGNFQETSVLTVHLIGAMIAFGIGTVYLWIQVYSQT